MATPSAAQRVAESPDVLEVIFEHCGLVRVGTELRRVHSSWRDLADTLPRRWATATIAGRLGNFGAGPAELELDDPECAVHLPDGGLAVTDTCNHRIQFFRPECASAGGTPFRSVGRRGSAPGEFNGPMGLATDGTHLFVVDCDNARVQQLRLADGVCVDSVGTRGSLEGQMLRPSGIARSPGLRRGVNAEQGDRLYVADTYNHRISVFGVAPLRFLFCFGREGDGPLDFQYPISLAAHGSVIYVADRGNSRIQITTRDGRYIGCFGALEASPDVTTCRAAHGASLDGGPGARAFAWAGDDHRGDAESETDSVADDNHGSLCAGGAGEESLRASGVGLCAGGSLLPGTFDRPVGVAVRPWDGRILVSSDDGHRVQLMTRWGAPLQVIEPPSVNQSLLLSTSGHIYMVERAVLAD